MPLSTGTHGWTVDLSDVEIAPAMLALRLAASSAVHEQAELPLKITPPRAPQACEQLARAGLAGVMGVEEPEATEDLLIPITRIGHISEVEAVAERLQATLRANLPSYLLPGADAFMLAFSELGDNACTHGSNPHGTFVLAQRYDPSSLVLAVGDLGVGIPQHLGATLNSSLGSADEAKLIAEALRPGVTATSKSRRGEGLPRIIETMKELRLPTAELRIWSGAGRVSLALRGHPSSRPRGRVISSDTPGTWVEVILTSSPTRESSG